jgi:RNA polymerase sigma-70 factor (ECF subfamily)
VTDDAHRRFDEVYRTYAPEILAYCARRVTREEAMDAASEVFVVALRRIDKIPPGEAALPWLYGTARNVLRNKARSTRRQRRLAAKVAAQGEPAVPGPEVQLVRSEDHQALIDAMGKLSDKDREIIRLVQWEGLSRDVVAEMFFVSRAAIDQRISRAYKRLGRTLGVQERETRTAPVPKEEAGEA